MTNESISSVILALSEVTQKYGSEKMDKILACIHDLKKVGDKHGEEIFTASINTIFDMAKKEQL